MEMQLGDLFTKIKASVNNLSRGKRLALAGIAGGALLCFMFSMMWLGKTNFELLYSNLAVDDAGAILEVLKAQKIPYRLSANGSSILIPTEQVHETRLGLASEGLPQGSGVGFEIFDNTKLGMTEFAQNVNYQRALQGELSRTINGFSEIESSRVHIVMPSRSLFVEEEEPAKASVVLRLRPDSWLSKDQIKGIVHLVSSSISGLAPDDVTIVDNYGKMLAGFEDEPTLGEISTDQLKLQEKVETGLENRVKTMLETALGAGKSIVRVSCSLNFKKQERTEEKYDPEGQIVRSEQVVNENSSGWWGKIPMGVPGVLSNTSEGGKATPATEESPTYQKQDRIANYEVSKITSHTVEPTGQISRISVAVLVDGTYAPVGAEGVEEGQQQWQYVPRTEEELGKLETIVKTAVNFDAERGDKVAVVNIPFETNKLIQENEIIEEGWLSGLKNYTPFLGDVLVAVLLLFSFMFAMRLLVRRLALTSGRETEMLAQLPKTVGEIESEYGGGITSLPFRDHVLQLITRNREHSIQLMKEWMKEKEQVQGDDRHGS